jgi:pseudaminic acid synthase
MSANHLQDFNRGLKIIDAAADAGAEALKLQTYTPETITINSEKEWFWLKKGKWAGENLYQLYRKAYTPWGWQPKLKKYGEKKGLVVFSFPLDETAVEFLEKMKVSLYKIGSPEIVDIPLLRKIGQTKKPVIMSVGMASIQEIELAMRTLKKAGCPQLAILHCVSAYPAKSEEINLATMVDIKERFKVVVGLSDHTLTTSTAVAAVTLGASIIEKHLTLSRAAGGADASFSLEPKEFKELVKSVREVERAVGKVKYGLRGRETETIVLRPSLFITRDIKKGELFTQSNVRSIRPGYGLSPRYYDEVIGRRSLADIARGTPLSWDLIGPAT